MKVLALYIDLNDIENEITIKYPYHIGIRKRSDILIIDEWYEKMEILR